MSKSIYDRTFKKIPHPCPVCGIHMFRELDSGEECAICGWQDDYFETDEVVRGSYQGGGARISIELAAENGYRLVLEYPTKITNTSFSQACQEWQEKTAAVIQANLQERRERKEVAPAYEEFADSVKEWLSTDNDDEQLASTYIHNWLHSQYAHLLQCYEEGIINRNQFLEAEGQTTADHIDDYCDSDEDPEEVYDDEEYIYDNGDRYYFYRNVYPDGRTDTIWWRECPNRRYDWVFTFDKKKMYHYYTDYPEN